jgi:hypothetical protein
MVLDYCIKEGHLKKTKGKKPKFPKLSDAYRLITGKISTDWHNARQDTEALLEIYLKIKSKEVYTYFKSKEEEK